MNTSSRRPSFRLLTHSLGVATLALGLVSAQAETVEKHNKSFSIPSGGKLVVDVDFGGIEVTSHAGDQVEVRVERKVSRGTKEDEQEFLQDRPVVFSQDGNTLTVRSRAEKKNAWNWKGKQRLEGKYTISVPRQFHTQLKTSGGSVEIQNLDGDAQLHTSGGNIRVAGGGGTLKGHTSGGSIAVKEFRGPVQVNTSGGSVQIEDVTGTVEGSTSGGSVSASLKAMPESVKLSTSGGNVTLRVPDNAAFDLDAATSGGSAGSELPVTITGKKSGSRLQGPVNGGGKPVVLRTSGGNVWVRKI